MINLNSQAMANTGVFLTSRRAPTNEAGQLLNLLPPTTIEASSFESHPLTSSVNALFSLSGGQHYVRNWLKRPKKNKLSVDTVMTNTPPAQIGPNLSGEIIPNISVDTVMTNTPPAQIGPNLSGENINSVTFSNGTDWTTFLIGLALLSGTILVVSNELKKAHNGGENVDNTGNTGGNNGGNNGDNNGFNPSDGDNGSFNPSDGKDIFFPKRVEDEIPNILDTVHLTKVQFSLLLLSGATLGIAFHQYRTNPNFRASINQILRRGQEKVLEIFFFLKQNLIAIYNLIIQLLYTVQELIKLVNSIFILILPLIKYYLAYLIITTLITITMGQKPPTQIYIPNWFSLSNNNDWKEVVVLKQTIYLLLKKLIIFLNVCLMYVYKLL